MPLQKSILRNALKVLKQYAEGDSLQIKQSKHITIRGQYRGNNWVFTLPCSPSWQYMERAMRSFRKFRRQYN